MAKPVDMSELRVQLLEAFDLLRNDPKREAQVSELANTAGKIISTCKVQIAYALMRGEEPEVAFMGKTSGRPIKPTARRMIE
jgi:hypothetical protein